MEISESIIQKYQEGLDFYDLMKERLLVVKEKIRRLSTETYAQKGNSYKNEVVQIQFDAVINIIESVKEEYDEFLLAKFNLIKTFDRTNISENELAVIDETVKKVKEFSSIGNNNNYIILQELSTMATYVKEEFPEIGNFCLSQINALMSDAYKCKIDDKSAKQFDGLVITSYPIIDNNGKVVIGAGYQEVL